MGKCCVEACTNTPKNKVVDLSFFPLPRDDKRCRLWLKAVGRNDLLTKPGFKPWNYLVCSEHFKRTDFRLVRRYLTTDAVPSQFFERKYRDYSADDYSRSAKLVDTDIQTNTETKILKNKENLLNQGLLGKTHISTDKQTQISTSQEHQLEDEDTRSSETCCIELENDETKMELDSKSIPLTVANSEYPDDEVGNRFRTLIKWQNKLKTEKGNKYSVECKMSALNLHYSSPSAYRCLQKVLELPDRSALSSLNISIPPRLDDRVLGALKLKIKHLPDIATHCTLTVGEIPLKKNMYYNIKTDEIIGFHNINGKASPEMASIAFVITLQGIQYKWEQPIAYALLAGDKHLEELDNWLSEVINKLTDVGINVHAIISDQDSNFDKFVKSIKEVTAEKPYFICNGKKVYYMYDVLYLAKYVHATLPTRNYFCDGEKIAWKYVKGLYKDQKNRNMRLIPNITEAHIMPNNSREIGVRHASEVFSGAVASALHTYIDLEQITEKARPTANFLETMNNLLDVFNSRKLNNTNKLTNHQEKVLDEANEMFKMLKATDKETGQDNAIVMECFVNFQITIQAVKMIYEDLKKEGCKFLFTGQLNRNSLESFLNSIRQQNSELTPVQFRRAFSKLYVSNMLKKSPPKLNSDMDICNILDVAEDVMNSAHTIAGAPSPRSAVYLSGDTDYRIDLPKENAATYIAAYLWYKCMKKHEKCSRRADVLKSVSDIDDMNLRDKYKDYNKNAAFYSDLKMPPEGFVTYIQQLEKKFRQQFRNCVQTSPGKELLKVLRRIPANVPCICFPREYLLKHFIRLRIYTTLRFNNRQYKHNVY